MDAGGRAPKAGASRRRRERLPGSLCFIPASTWLMDFLRINQSNPMESHSAGADSFVTASVFGIGSVATGAAGASTGAACMGGKSDSFPPSSR